MAVLLIPIPLLAQNSTRTFQVLVVTQDDKAISDAFVLMHDYQSSGHGSTSENWEGRTQGDGSITFSGVEGRCYDVFVSKGAMLPYSQRICVKSSTAKIRLKPDPHPHLSLD